MGKLDIKTYLASHKGKPVNRLFYKIMRAFVAGPQAKKMNCEVIDNVGVKATTTERLGYEGREEGITAYATCLLLKTE